MSQENNLTQIPASTDVVNIDPPKKRGKKKFTNYELLKLNVKGMPQKKLAELTNTSKTNISRRLGKYISKLELLNDPVKMRQYLDNKSNIFNAAEELILDYLVKPETLEKASANNLAYSLQNIYNINRLEQGKSQGQSGNIYVNILLQSTNNLFPKHIETIKVNNNNELPEITS